MSCVYTVTDGEQFFAYPCVQTRAMVSIRTFDEE